MGSERRHAIIRSSLRSGYGNREVTCPLQATADKTAATLPSYGEPWVFFLVGGLAVTRKGSGGVFVLVSFPQSALTAHQDMNNRLMAFLNVQLHSRVGAPSTASSTITSSPEAPRAAFQYFTCFVHRHRMQ